MRTVKVPLVDRAYPIRIGSGLLADLGTQCARLKLGRRCAVISDATVARRYRQPALASLKAAGFEPAPLWRSVYYHKSLKLLLMVYVDDF